MSTGNIYKMIKLEKINDLEVICDWKGKMAPVFPGQEKITGPHLYFPNFIITSQKGSGKTVLAVSLIRELAANKTKIVIFSPTFNNGDDKNALTDLQERFPGMIEVFPRIKTSEGSILERKIEDAKERYEIIKQKNYEHTFPNYIFLFDDLNADDMKDQTMDYLYRTNRHIGAITILIEHRLNSSASTVVRDNTDIVCVFSGLSNSQTEDIYNLVNIPNISKKDFVKVYHKAVEGPGKNFLFINKTNRELRKNLNEKITIE